MPLAPLPGADPSPATPSTLSPRHAEDMAQGLELFQRQVRGILLENCVACHGGKRTRVELDLVSREGLLRGGKHGPAIVAGASARSLLYRVITHAEEPHMPHKADRLNPEQLAAMARWIDLGAPYDKPLIASGQRSAGKVVDDEDRAFWSFQPLSRPPLPALPTAATRPRTDTGRKSETGTLNQWCRDPVDRFVVARLAEQGLEPSLAATRRKLIRRLSFDLIGLPPALDSVAAFIDDPDPDAYDRLVDRLLADPRFGERWGRHWLDLARFAESHGFEHDTDREYAYHFRDFVIRALNRDQPYDEFVRWQIAGDELAPDHPDAMAATGFLAAGVHATQITANQVEKERYDELDDMANTLGTAMLGLSIGCARCHDHKYDPIPSHDYYTLLSTFTTTVRSDHDVIVNVTEHQSLLEDFFVKHQPFEDALHEFERNEHPDRFAKWLSEGDHLRADAFPWYVPEVVEAKSQASVDFTPLRDGSLFVSGNNGIKDTYTIVLETRLTTIHSVRLDALADSRLPGAGPGRGEGGKFAFNRFKITAQALQPAGTSPPATPRVTQKGIPAALPEKGATATSDALGEPRELALEFGAETFVEGGEPIPYPGDRKGRLDWVVTEPLGRTHTLLIRFPEPVQNEHGSRLVFELGFRREHQGNMGRPRISLSNAPTMPGVSAGVLPERLRGPLSRVAAGEGGALGKAEKNALERWHPVIDPRWRELDKAREAHLGTQPRPQTEKMLVCSEGVAPLRLNTQGEDYFEETYFLSRGDPNQKLGVARQNFLQVLIRAKETPTFSAPAFWQEAPPAGSRLSYRRRALAGWLTDVDRGAGNLLARVIVNRLWQHLMGRGIVATPSDFGAQGEAPSHPALLEALAVELTENGWQLKPLLRRLLTSAVYRQSAADDLARARKDPENRWFWRRTPRRLEAEIVRDALLQVGNTLKPSMFGPGTLDETHRRRSIYFFVKRSKLVSMMTVFDAPDALQGISQRSVTTVAPQALFLLNSPVVQDAVRAFADELTRRSDTLEGQLRTAYEIAMSRSPSGRELEAGIKFVAEQAASYQGFQEEGAAKQALADFCQILVSLNEFIYID